MMRMCSHDVTGRHLEETEGAKVKQCQATNTASGQCPEAGEPSDTGDKVPIIPTRFEGPTGVDERSSKPEKFHDIVSRASYGQYDEAFQRSVRPKIQNLYELKQSEAPSFSE